MEEFALESKEVTPNPYDYISEVRNPKLFAGRREELAQVEEDVARLAADHAVVPMVAIVGERRIGKTSLSLRIQEISDRHDILTLRVSLTDLTAVDPWQFWHDILYGLLSTAGARTNSVAPGTVFQAEPADVKAQIKLTMDQLEFFGAYHVRTFPIPPNHLIFEGLRSLVEAICESDKSGVLLILDEAHLLVDNRVMMQQLRFAVREAGRLGVVFVGETELANLFADQEQPLFAQGRVIPLGYFANQSDIAECALLPLAEDERPLVSPMTVDYLDKLSQGKPNQIRLICHSIYNRYKRGQQSDLNISIGALDDVLDSIAATYSEYDVKQKVDGIRRLGSVDLEMLYNMTRYPNWAIEDIVELDESFRAEGISLAATSRREAMLKEKRGNFVRLGLMDDDTDRCTLAGDEFLALYLRFWYEVQRHGRLSRSLVLGKGPPTPFGEKADKLVRFVTWELERKPTIVINTFGTSDLGNEDHVEAVKARFATLQGLFDDGPTALAGKEKIVHEWFRTCELVRQPGQHHLLCLSVRSLENPRETMCIELYFESAEIPLVFSIGMLKSLRQRAEHSRMLIVGWDSFTVSLPSLDGLLEAIGAPQLEEVLAQVGALERWRLEAVQHHIGGGNDREDTELVEADDPAAAEWQEWLELYERGDVAGAERCVNRQLRGESERYKSARLHNDRGYIRYGLQQEDEARRDLQRALDLHFNHLPVTLSNLSVAEIDCGNYDLAIEHIRDAMFLTLTAEDVTAAYLRLRLPAGQRASKTRWEQNPGNVLEAGYVNLSFAYLQTGNPQTASELLEEGLTLMPSSVRLKHALARLRLSLNRADLAEPIYRELGEQQVSDPALANEIRAVLRAAPRRRAGKRRNR